MAGAPTRFGFAGDAAGTPPDDGDVKDSRLGRTVYGHERHLPAAGLPARAGTPRVLAVAAPAVPAPTPRVPRETPHVRRGAPKDGRSRFPALARLLGRWNSAGVLVAQSDLDGGDLLVVPRERYLRQVLIVGGAALLGFFAVLGLASLRDKPPGAGTGALAPVARPAPAPARPSPSSVARRPASPALEPTRSSPAPVVGARGPAAASPSPRTGANPTPADAAPPRRRARRAGPSLGPDPDGPLPLTF